MPDDARTRVTLPDIPEALHRASGVHGPASETRIARSEDGTLRCPWCDAAVDLEGLDIGAAVDITCGCGFAAKTE